MTQPPLEILHPRSIKPSVRLLLLNGPPTMPRRWRYSQRAQCFIASPAALMTAPMTLYNCLSAGLSTAKQNWHSIGRSQTWLPISNPCLASSKAELAQHRAIALQALKPGGLLWFAYPKKSSGLKTDITRDVGWDAVTQAGLKGVAQVAIDETWSALRFRPVEEVGT